MRHFVTSTLTNPTRITNWTRPIDPNQPPEIMGKPVLIKGGANLATDPHTERGRFTPKGVTTEITEEQLEYCMHNNHFKKHLKDGLMIVVSEADAEKVAKDLNPKDSSAPLTPSDPHFNKPDDEEMTAIKPMEDKSIVHRIVDKVTRKKD